MYSTVSAMYSVSLFTLCFVMSLPCTCGIVVVADLYTYKLNRGTKNGHLAKLSGHGTERHVERGIVITGHVFRKKLVKW